MGEELIFENEVDIAMECLLSKEEKRNIDSIVESANENILISEKESDIINTLSIPLEESDIDPVGIEADKIISTEQEILSGDGYEVEMIDMMMF